MSAKDSNSNSNGNGTHSKDYVKKYLQEITELERSYHKVVNERIELIQNLKELEKKEVLLAQQLVNKKNDFRKNTESASKKLRRERKSFKISYKHLQKSVSAVSEGKDMIIRTSPNKVESIDPEEPSVFYSTKTEMFPHVKIKPLSNGSSHVLFYGPRLPENGSSVNIPPSDVYRDILCARSVSTYPLSNPRTRREGDPICDSYCIRLLKNRAIIALADGANWGNRPYNASKKASEKFAEFMFNNHKNFSDIRETAQTLLKGIGRAHNAIIKGIEDVWDAGTTTLIGGILMEVERSKSDSKSETEDLNNYSRSSINGTEKQSKEWVFSLISVGDCKAFHYNAKTKSVVDITEGNRYNLTDASDPGGRIGPYLHEGSPDLRNLDFYMQRCYDDDLLILVTDGVHDNVDPQTLGRTPKQCNINAETWEEAEKEYPGETEDAKTLYRKTWFETVFQKIEKEKERLEPKDICNYVLDYCVDITRNNREYLENNPGKRMIFNYVDYPGKPDHTTIIVLKVGPLVTDK